jgi:hypothetical protein
MISSVARCVRGGRLSVVQTLRATLANLLKPLPWRTKCGFDLLIDEAFTALRLDPNFAHFIQLFDTVDTVISCYIGDN